MAQLAIIALAASAVVEGLATKRAKEGEANQLYARAQSRRASGSQAMAREIQQMELVESRARAVAGQSGTDLTSPGTVKILGQIRAEGEYRAMTALWNSEESALGDEYAAKLANRQGRAALQAGVIKAGATAMAGYSSMKQGVPVASDGKKYWGMVPN